jgi:hypothetical protein
VDGSNSRISTAERWAESQARRTVLSSVAAVVILGVLMVFLVVHDQTAMWLIPFWLFLVLSEWERIGFKRLLARRDAEIGWLRSGAGSAQQAHRADSQ